MLHNDFLIVFEKRILVPDMTPAGKPFIEWHLRHYI